MSSDLTGALKIDDPAAPYWATVDQRLLQAGIRLAGRLDRLLGPGRPCGPAVASGGPNL